MKKILSVLVVCTLLLATLGITASAAAFYEYGNLNTRVTVMKSNSVKIDGVISDGEYAEYTDGYTEWYVAENASDYFGDAEEMGETAKWYFSWDGKYLNIAAKWNAGSGANQAHEAGDFYGDYAFEDVLKADDFLGFGPGINVVSAEVSPEDDQWTRTFVAVSENTASGEKMIGMYSGQNGQNMDYKPAFTDFDFTYEGTWVTAEYRIPIIELSETFKENQGNQMFKASIVLQAGVAGNVEVAEGEEINAATYCWGVRLGQMGYASDSGNTDKTWATFRLVDDVIEGPGPGEETIVPPTTGGTVTPPTTGGTVTPPTTGGTVTPPTTGGTVTPPATNGGDKPVAPPTGDIMVVAAVVSAISACGVMIAKKRK